MADFIRREDALKVLCNNYAYAAMDVIKRLPAALAESENGQRIVMELELKHMQEGGDA